MMDSTQLVAPMAQFSSIVGLAEMNASIRAIASQFNSGQIGDAASWIGKSALIAGDFVNRGADGTYAGQVNLEAPANTVGIELLDANGLIVHSHWMPRRTGPVFFQWDGNGENGPAVGPLRVRVTARDGEVRVATTTNVWTRILALQSSPDGSDQHLVTPNGMFAPKAALRLG